MNKWHYSGSDNWDLMTEIIIMYHLDGEDVLRLLTDYHSLDLINGDFMENLIEYEGYSV